MIMRKSLMHWKRLLVILINTVWVLPSLAYDFASGGIYYRITNSVNKTVEVTYQNYYSGYSSDYYTSGYSGSVTVPSSVYYNGSYYSVTAIGNHAFDDATVTSVTVPSSILSIGDCAFTSCDNLTSFNFPSNLTNIGYNAFSGCVKLTEINIPRSVSTLSNYAFWGCNALANIYVNWTTPLSISGNTFSSSAYSNATLHVPTGYLSVYSSSSVWSGFSITDGTSSQNRDCLVTANNANVTLSYSSQNSYEWRWAGDRFQSSNQSMHSTTSQTTITLTAPTACQMSFDYGVSSESNYDKLYISVDGKVIVNNISGSQAGAHASMLSAGTHSLVLKYSKDGSTNAGSDCGYISNMRFLGNYLYADDINARAGRSVVLPIYMNNDTSICNLQFYLDLPSGITIAYDEEEEMYAIDKGERAKDKHVIDCMRQTNGMYKILCSSTTNKTFRDTDKSLPIMYVTLNVPSTKSVGSYPIYIRNSILNHYDEETGDVIPYDLDVNTSNINVQQYYTVTASSENEAYGTVSISGTNYIQEEGVAAANSVVSFRATAAPNYRFSYWKENGSQVSTSNPYSPSITRNRNLTAVFVYDVYNVTFMVDGVIYQSGSQLHGALVQVPAVNPVKRGYTFIGWEGLTETTTVPDHDVVYNAVFEQVKYSVKFIAMGQVVSEQMLPYGAAIVAPEPPLITNYGFVTWGNVDAIVTDHDLTFEAQYTLMGDVFEDNQLNVSDLTKLVGFILNDNASIDDRSFISSDIFEDGQINVSDYSRLVGRILNEAASQRSCPVRRLMEDEDNE